jgi:transaldolase
MNSLQRLHAEQSQSPWLDNLRRSWIDNGELAGWVERGIRGLTSNPSIFQKAIEGSPEYDEQFSELIADGASIEDAYWALVTRDIEGALAVMRPVHDDSKGEDGYVSVEVDPGLANDTEGTTKAARVLHESIDEPNLMVKIPGTAAGLPSIQQMIAEGRSINVTLIFSVPRHLEVMEAYVAGLEAHVAAGATDLSHISSVASFFISRTETEVDRRLDAIGTPEAIALKGKAAVAQGQAAYTAFLEKFSGERWDALAALGARVQRPLWASTSTKDPSYPDTLYVDELIGPDTVNTMPDNTIEAFLERGTVARSVDADPAGAQSILDQVTELGIDLDEVSDLLEDQGVASFIKSFDELLASLTVKADSLR